MASFFDDPMMLSLPVEPTMPTPSFELQFSNVQPAAEKVAAELKLHPDLVD